MICDSSCANLFLEGSDSIGTSGGEKAFKILHIILITYLEMEFANSQGRSTLDGDSGRTRSSLTSSVVEKRRVAAAAGTAPMIGVLVMFLVLVLADGAYSTEHVESRNLKGVLSLNFSLNFLLILFFVSHCCKNSVENFRSLRSQCAFFVNFGQKLIALSFVFCSVFAAGPQDAENP